MSATPSAPGQRLLLPPEVIGVSISTLVDPMRLRSISTFGPATALPEPAALLASLLSSSPPSSATLPPDPESDELEEPLLAALPDEAPDDPPPDEPEEEPDDDVDPPPDALPKLARPPLEPELTLPPETRVPVSDAWTLAVMIVVSRITVCITTGGGGGG
ncbi:MAG: hypothetical protein WAQ05_02950, partial [Rubrivivax sp.]